MLHDARLELWDLIDFMEIFLSPGSDEAMCPDQRRADAFRA